MSKFGSFKIHIKPYSLYKIWYLNWCRNPVFWWMSQNGCCWFFRVTHVPLPILVWEIETFPVESGISCLESHEDCPKLALLPVFINEELNRATLLSLCSHDDNTWSSALEDFTSVGMRFLCLWGRGIYWSCQVNRTQWHFLKTWEDPHKCFPWFCSC